MAANTPCSQHLRLGEDWQVCSAPLDTGAPTEASSCADTIAVPECVHLQPVLYPDQPYWGSHICAINERTWIYRKAFTAPHVPYRRARLRFDGVDYFASVWLNGRFAG